MGRWGAVLVGMAWSPAAQAQQDLGLCKAGFSPDDLRVRVDSSSSAIATAETEVARRLAKRTYDQLPCLDAIVPSDALAGFAWVQAWLAYSDQDESAASRWVRLARFADEGGELPAFVPANHPFRSFASDDVAPPTASGDGRPVAPKGGGLFLDGRFLPVLSAVEDAPGLFQIADGTGRVLASQWVEGTAFPEEFVGPPGSPAKAPRWWTGTAVAGSEAPAPSPRSESRTPVGRLVASGGLALAAGGLYALASASTGGLADAATEQELAAARSRVNLMSIGSGVLAASALGVGVSVLF